MIEIIFGGMTKSVPPCTLFEATLNPQQKSAERNSNGRLLRETLPDKWSLKLEWEFSKAEDFYAWFSYLKQLTRFDFQVKFPAPTGKIEQATFYISPISAKMLGYYKTAAGQWKNLKCSFVEV